MGFGHVALRRTLALSALLFAMLGVAVAAADADRVKDEARFVIVYSDGEAGAAGARRWTTAFANIRKIKVTGRPVAVPAYADHIRRVVTMQNAFARTGDVDERVEVRALIEEAIALGCPDADRHGLTLTRAVAPGTSVTIDRHRVRQIAVNLLANARDSILVHRARLGAQAGPGQIGVRAAVDAGWLELAVDDDGDGIPAEVLPRIFNAGFTTKAHGHGHGLHSSSLAAEHLGGTLRCTSAGTGHGASFVLRVPVDPPGCHAA